VLKHVVLQAALQNKVTSSSESMKEELAKSGATIDLAKAAAKSLHKLVTSLEVSKDRSAWSDYRTTCTYSSESAAFKRDFVEAAAKTGSPKRILDLGANDGEYSILVAPHCDQVIACDFDELVVDRLYRRLRAEGPSNVLPLVIDLTDPSPGIGWANRERKPWQERMQPDLVLALALVHHLAIGANVPLPMVVEWMRGFNARLVIEFVDPDDPQSKRLLANKPSGLFDDYTRSRFEELVTRHFDVVRAADVPGQPRKLYELDPKA
jgi:ribosomal protein L11 methylase PrmA